MNNNHNGHAAADREKAQTGPQVGIIMGSASDRSVMQPAVDILKELGISVEVRILSAHRTPEETAAYAREAQSRGLEVLIAGAGRAAHLPGVLAAYTLLPVIGVPVGGGPLSGLDALYAIVQMPPGIPVATMAVDGALNAGLFAAQIIAAKDGAVRRRLEMYRQRLREQVKERDRQLQKEEGEQ